GPGRPCDARSLSTFARDLRIQEGSAERSRPRARNLLLQVLVLPQRIRRATERAGPEDRIPTQAVALRTADNGRRRQRGNPRRRRRNGCLQIHAQRRGCERSRELPQERLLLEFRKPAAQSEFPRLR